MTSLASTLERSVDRPVRPVFWRHLRDDGTLDVHSATCPCQKCSHADLLEQPPHRPTYALRTIAELWPDVAWLAWLPLAERRWYRSHQDALMRRYQNVPGEVWAKLFP